MKPPSAGPTMVALWFAVAEPATARGTSGSGTRLGTIVCIAVSSKARAPPITNAMPRISSREIAPETAAMSSTAAMTASTAWQVDRMKRRS